MPPAENPPTPPSRSAFSSGRLLRGALRLLHAATRTAWTLFVAGLALLLYAWLVGLPGRVTDLLFRRLDTAPFEFAVGRLTLDPTEGLVAEDVFLYRQGDFSEPLARLGRLSLAPDPRAWWRHGWRLHAVRVEAGHLLFPPWPPAATSPAPPRLAFSDLHARLIIESNRFDIAGLTTRLFDLQVSGSGTVARSPDAARPRNVWRELDAFLTSVQQAPPGLREVAREAADVRCTPPAQAAIDFALAPAQPETWRVDARIEAASCSLRGASFDAFGAKASWRAQQLTVRDASFRIHDQKVQADGTFDLTSRVVQVHLAGDLPPAQWIALLPRAWQGTLRAAGASAEGPVRGELWVGPAPLGEAHRAFRGSLSLEKASIRGLWLEQAHGTIASSGDQLHVDQLTAIVGRDNGRGPVSARFTWDRSNQVVRGDLRIACAPGEAASILTSNQALLVQRFTFPGPPPVFEGTFERSSGATTQLTVQGRIVATNLTYREVPIEALDVQLAYANRMLTLAPWHFTRPEGQTRGSLAMDFAKELYTVDLESTMHPQAVAGMVGPRLAHATAGWRFDGPTRLHVRGVIDAADVDGRTDLQVEAEGERMGRGPWLADTCTFTLHAMQGQYLATNVRGTAFGGDFAAVVDVHPTKAGPEHRFEIQAALTNAQFARVVAARGRATHQDLTGRLHGTLTLSGLVNDAAGPATLGHGALSIQKGNLFRLPLLGGLSRLLAMIYPGLGFAEENDFSCTYVIEDSEVVTDDVRLEGAVVSMKARGHYALDGDMRFVVEVQLLRKGPLATVLRFVTLPFTKLLQFQLSGSLDEPKWRPVNLPKEMFLIFD